MRGVIPSMAPMKKVSFIFDIHIPKPEVFCTVFEDNQSFISVAESIFFHREQNILLLSIIISEALQKRKLFGYVTLIQENKQQKFLLSHSIKHHSFILEESDLDGKTFYSTQGGHITQT